MTDLNMISQALKTIKADLANEGRLDILDKVRAYRGGMITFSTRLAMYSLEVHQATLVRYSARTLFMSTTFLIYG